MKYALLIALTFHFFLIGCNNQVEPQTVLEESPPIQNNNVPAETPKQIGTMTTSTAEEIGPIDISNQATINKEDLLRYVQNAIIPEYKDWVVFKNGSYVVFDRADTIPDVQQSAKRLLRYYAPKKPEDNYWGISITDLDKEDAWSVFGNGYGIYTIVHATELEENPDPQKIGNYAKAKRALDEKNPQVIFVSNAAGIRSIQ